MSEPKRRIILTYDESGIHFDWGDFNWLERTGLIELARVSMETSTTRHFLAAEIEMTENKSDNDT